MRALQSCSQVHTRGVHGAVFSVHKQTHSRDGPVLVLLLGQSLLSSVGGDVGKVSGGGRDESACRQF